MPSAIIHLDDEYDKKVSILKIQTGAKSKNIVLENIIKEYFDKRDKEKER